MYVCRECVNMLYSLQLLPYLLCRNGLSFKHPGKLQTHTLIHKRFTNKCLHTHRNNKYECIQDTEREKKLVLNSGSI